ncbi:GntR family transcriptional regulator [Tessaracoccus sp. G1721]
MLRIQPVEVPVSLDRDSHIPLYQQLYDQLAAAIVDGTLRPGERVEAELSMAERLGLSRLTVRRTLAELVNHGLLIRGRGLGTVVARRQKERPGGLTSLHSDLAAAGHTPTTTLLRLSYPVTDSDVARRLGVGSRTPLLYLERLRLADGVPLAILRNWLPPSSSSMRFADLENQGLYASLRQHGVDPLVATQRIGGRHPTPAERDLLNIGALDPVLTLTRTSVDRVGRGVECGEHTFRADRHGFDLTVWAEHADGGGPGVRPL